MRIRQIVFAAHDLAHGRDTLARVLQLEAPFRDPGVAEFGIDNAVFAFGDQFIEVISPLRGAGEGAGADRAGPEIDRGAHSACARHLARHGEGGYMLILQTDDLARERARLDALGVRRVWSADFDDISAMHLHPKDVGAAIVSLDEPRPAASWRWGGPAWRVAPGPRGEQRVRGLTLRAPDAPAAQALAARWAELFGHGQAVPWEPAASAAREPMTTSPGAAPTRWRIALDEGFVDIVVQAGRPEGIAGFTLAATAPVALFDAARAAGLRVAEPRIELLGASVEVTALR